MKNIFRNRTIIGITCIVVALAICFGLTPMYNTAITAKTEMVRVSQDILKGEVITKDMLQVVEIGEYNLPDNIIRDKENIIGKYANSDIYKGDYLMADKLSDSPLVNYAYLYDFDGSERAISVTIKTFAAGLSGKLEPGDIVTIMVSDFGERKETITPIELQYVQVLAVTASSGLDTEEYVAPEESNYAEDEKELPSTITLKVSADQAKLLADLEIKGKIHAVFVYRGSEENCNEFLEEQKVVLEEIRLQKEEEERLAEDEKLRLKDLLNQEENTEDLDETNAEGEVPMDDIPVDNEGGEIDATE
ncbi:Pilus assembly protein CpaB [Petrocella atlantisensis]|uniref:Pilus assembly protein CpaB n=1 Tax=Petrocella atlantisensis TaxID=2173034 RepID=A0A3P7NWI9_9FIRM|nr:Flp pilus assembly protein CpaB [Petrocella atlantisensis]VDN47295.1 Pilus assembly protein CpaB [Petrocella atlantisensis]